MAWPPRSLRARIAVAFALGGGVVLVAASLFLYANLIGEVTLAVNQGLRARADDIGADLRAGIVRVRQEEAFAEVVDEQGKVVASSATIAGGAPVLTPAELRAASTREVVLVRDVPGLGPDSRLLARPQEGPGGQYVLVVGADQDALLRAQARLGVILAVALPLLVAGLGAGGWLVTGVALRSVRRMSDEAAAISLAEPGRRLPQPEGTDEIAQLAHTLNDMLGRIEASFARERAFVDDASHELRTPIAILRGELELASGRPEDPEEVVRSLHSALEEVDRLAALAENLLVLARADVGAVIKREPTDLLAVAEAVRDRVLATGPLPAVEITGTAVSCPVDTVAAEQILANLVGNARRHARSRVVVDVAAEEGGAAVVQVADDGPGFPPGLLDSAFERFSRGEAARERERGGAGLGLAIVHALVTAHGGSVSVANGAPLGGALVVLRLPGS